jgi:xanthine dehydrogenase accessory factor
MSNLRHDNNLVDKTAGLGPMLAALRSGRPVVAATAVTRDGIGHRLLLGPDGDILGGAEGGLLEGRAVAGLGQLPADGWSAVVRDSTPLGRLDADEAAAYGAITRLVFERFEPDQATLSLVGALGRALATGRPGLVVTRVGQEGPAGRSLLLDGRILGDPLPGAVTAEALGPGAPLAGPTLLETAAGPYVLDPYRPLPALFLAGAGLVSRRLAPLAGQAGFRVVVMDTDAAMASLRRFPLADAVLAVPDFADCFQGQAVDADASVVVFTRGHAHDAVVLAQALATPAGYVGLMACKADGQARLAGLGRQGVPEADLARVRTPIGLPIGGKTPFEIAVSILAEVIGARSARKKAMGQA